MAAQHHKNRDGFHNIWINESMERRCNQTKNVIQMFQILLSIMETCVITCILAHDVQYAVGEHQGINLCEVSTYSKKIIHRIKVVETVRDLWMSSAPTPCSSRAA